MNNVIFRSLLSTFVASSVIATENQMELLTNNFKAAQKSYKTYLENKTPELRFNIIANLNNLLIKQNLEDTDKEEALKIAKDLHATHLAIRIDYYFQKDRAGLQGNLPIELIQYILCYASQNSSIREAARLLTLSKALNWSMLQAPMSISCFYHRTDRAFNKAIDHFPSMTSLSITSTPTIKNIGQKYIIHLSKLTSLEVSFTYSSRNSLEDYQDLTNLTSLRLQGSRSTANGLRDLSKLTNLQELNFSESIVPYQDLKHLVSLTKLRSLELLYLDFKGSSEEGFTPLPYLPNLSFLRIGTKCLGTEMLNFFQRQTNLRSLKLQGSRNHDTDTGLIYVANFNKLERLNLHCNSIVGTGLSYLQGLTNLTKLNFGLTLDFDKNNLKYIEALTNLTSLNLTQHLLWDNDLKYLQTLTKLAKLDLSYNKIKDEGLSYLKDLRNLTNLDIKGNVIKQAAINAFKIDKPDLKIEKDRNE